jgi:hypothetical protein
LKLWAQQGQRYRLKWITSMAPKTKVRYKDPKINEGTFEILECECAGCLAGDTHLVSLQSNIVDIPVNRHVGHEMIEVVL